MNNLASSKFTVAQVFEFPPGPAPVPSLTGEQLRRARLALGLKQTQFAALVGRTTITVRMAEKCEGEVPRYMVLALEALAMRKAGMLVRLGMVPADHVRVSKRGKPALAKPTY